MDMQFSYSAHNLLIYILLFCVLLFFSGCIDNSVIATFSVAQNVISLSNTNVSLSVLYSLNRDATVTVAIYNRAKQRVHVLVDNLAQQSGTSYSYAWNAQDSNGNRVRAGYYYLLLSTPQAQRTVAVYLSENL